MPVGCCVEDSLLPGLARVPQAQSKGIRPVVGLKSSPSLHHAFARRFLFSVCRPNPSKNPRLLLLPLLLLLCFDRGAATDDRLPGVGTGFNKPTRTRPGRDVGSGGFEGGATAPPRGALGAEPQAKNAKIGHQNALRVGFGSGNPSGLAGTRRIRDPVPTPADYPDTRPDRPAPPRMVS